MPAVCHVPSQTTDRRPPERRDENPNPHVGDLHERRTKVLRYTAVTVLLSKRLLRPWAHRRREIGFPTNVAAFASHQLVGVAHDARLDDVGERSVLRIKVGSKLARDERAPHVSSPVPREAGRKRGGVYIYK